MRLPLIAALCAVTAGPALADYSVALTDIGKRDYYCTITVELTNNSDTVLTEINAFFLNHIGDEQVGRSKGASFMNVAPGASASATFETPNAPCSATETQVESYQMVIGACRIDNAFEDKNICVDRMTLTDPFSSAVPLN
ncbi:hypothetical protein [Tateyamaria omphalii]|uniref:Tat pathway signal sequence domain protein n=1 Tax=Tateyamaria omphalii TaxID=299262 RepID=A0A1P8N191_9RHOB|nr:hypothetical protein [Tateyamaria omphalii]APX14084.1 hypothetical protein BWR18_19665 [Tateyamaria omphalii]